MTARDAKDAKARNAQVDRLVGEMSALLVAAAERGVDREVVLSAITYVAATAVIAFDTTAGQFHEHVRECIVMIERRLTRRTPQ